MYALSTILAYIATAKDRRDEKGATAVEYGLLVALIAAIIIGVVTTIGQDVLTGFNKVANALPNT
ncbi:MULTISPECIES: Flp family type IVb pilin [unclassified Aeromicrobium]|uniref:Flp family type IVb pilin n=1 Tax=unclassified Aeromicrobium TaxID=2633570 RepID=UPI00209777D8|nr:MULTISPECIES: Flp family type IVb pilin [unclassified Aeromicrobium]MCO7239039.1 Flp family type IVb pilin [Aeromicrobium sp. CnD17-E]MDR6120397.1 pilus assembly protein Flp/PilA [Aeromicrobium sp. SORGH_AS_0981]